MTVLRGVFRGAATAMAFVACGVAAFSFVVFVVVSLLPTTGGLFLGIALGAATVAGGIKGYGEAKEWWR